MDFLASITNCIAQHPTATLLVVVVLVAALVAMYFDYNPLRARAGGKKKKPAEETEQTATEEEINSLINDIAAESK